MKFKIRKAERRQAKLRLALIGVAGSGKTTGAIKIASGMGGKFVVIDTERRSADLFAHLADFDVLELDNPFTPKNYIDAIHACEEAGYDTIIIDSLSHAWMGEGGVLEMHYKATQASTSKNSYMAWGNVTPEQNRLVDTILQSSSHIIVTMRSKTKYEVINDDGKKRPVKIGLAPIQREGLDYEFTVVLTMDRDSKMYSSSKDRTDIFEESHEKISPATGKKLMEWLMEGKTFSEVQEEEKILQEEERKLRETEISSLKNNLLMADTIDILKANFIDARKKYPDLIDEFTQIASERKQEIQQNNMGVH